MKIKMDKGASCVVHGAKFDTEIPVISFDYGYLWVGGENGPCYATLSGSVTLRKLAKEILRKHPERKKRKVNK